MLIHSNFSFTPITSFSIQHINLSLIKPTHYLVDLFEKSTNIDFFIYICISLLVLLSIPIYLMFLNKVIIYLNKSYSDDIPDPGEGPSGGYIGGPGSGDRDPGAGSAGPAVFEIFRNYIREKIENSPYKDKENALAVLNERRSKDGLNVSSDGKSSISVDSHSDKLIGIKGKEVVDLTTEKASPATRNHSVTIGSDSKHPVDLDSYSSTYSQSTPKIVHRIDINETPDSSAKRVRFAPSPSSSLDSDDLGHCAVSPGSTSYIEKLSEDFFDERDLNKLKKVQEVSRYNEKGLIQNPIEVRKLLYKLRDKQCDED